MHKKLILSRNKTQETTELVRKISRDSKNNKTRVLQITVNRIHVTNNRKARKKKTYADVVKVTQTQPLVSKNISSYVNEKDGENQFNLEKIKSLLMKDEKFNPSRIGTSPPIINSKSIVNNSSNSFSKSGDFLEDILKELGKVEKAKEHDVNVISLGRLRGHFCSNTNFNLSHRLLSDAEINLLEKGLDFAPIQRKINEPELREDFEEFFRRMRVKWHFRNELSESFIKKPAFFPKSSWKPHEGHPNLEVFLIQIENKLFKTTETPLGYCNLSKEKWEAVRILADDRNIVLEKPDKGSCVVIWDRNDYIKEARKSA